MRQVGRLRAVQAERPGDRVEHLRRHVLSVPLFEPRVVRDRDPRQLRQLLAAQPGHAAVAPVVRQAHVRGAQSRTAGTQELAQFGTLIKLVHDASIAGRPARYGPCS